MYKRVLIPNAENHSIEMPREFFGKRVEVIIMEVGDAAKGDRPVSTAGKKVNVNELFECFGNAPDFPSMEELRANAKPSKW